MRTVISKTSKKTMHHHWLRGKQIPLAGLTKSFQASFAIETMMSSSEINIEDARSSHTPVIKDMPTRSSEESILYIPS